MLRRFIRRAVISIRRAYAGQSVFEAFIVVTVVAVVALPLLGSKKAERGVRVGIVIDGPVTRADLIDTFRGELLELMGEEFGLEVPADAIVPSDYTAEGVRASLEAQALSRVGHTTLMMDVGARPVRQSLGTTLSEALQTPVAGALAVDAVASRTDGRRRRNGVKLWGIGPEFSLVGASPGVPGGT